LGRGQGESEVRGTEEQRTEGRGQKRGRDKRGVASTLLTKKQFWIFNFELK